MKLYNGGGDMVRSFEMIGKKMVNIYDLDPGTYTVKAASGGYTVHTGTLTFTGTESMAYLIEMSKLAPIVAKVTATGTGYAYNRTEGFFAPKFSSITAYDPGGNVIYEDRGDEPFVRSSPFYKKGSLTSANILLSEPKVGETYYFAIYVDQYVNEDVQYTYVYPDFYKDSTAPIPGFDVEFYSLMEREMGGYLELTFAATKTTDNPFINPFVDVKEGDFYYEPVMWAVQNGITTGATATTFNPGGNCLRAHVVTFLHRAEGNPELSSTKNPFTDVKTSDFFYKPVLWAVEKGITNGTSATTFGSYDNCNRAAVVTFLWRNAGSPEPKSTNNPFVDVKSTDFFYKPVLWAVEQGITNGLDATHFGPATACNRAQVVTFLYRAYN